MAGVCLVGRGAVGERKGRLAWIGHDEMSMRRVGVRVGERRGLDHAARRTGCVAPAATGRRGWIGGRSGVEVRGGNHTDRS